MMMKKSDLPVLFRDEGLTSLDRIFDKMLQTSFPDWGQEFGIDFFERNSFPKVDVIDNPSSIEIHAEVPGLSKNEIKISIEEGVLCISGQKSEKKDQTDAKYILKELKHSSFKRSFRLGDNLDTDKVDANFFEGMLNIHIPKKNAESKEKKMIEIKEGS